MRSSFADAPFVKKIFNEGIFLKHNGLWEKPFFILPKKRSDRFQKLHSTFPKKHFKEKRFVKEKRKNFRIGGFRVYTFFSRWREEFVSVDNFALCMLRWLFWGNFLFWTNCNFLFRFWTPSEDSVAFWQNFFDNAVMTAIYVCRGTLAET